MQVSLESEKHMVARVQHVNLKKLANAHETYNKSGMRQRNDSSTMQRFQPGWKAKMF